MSKSKRKRAASGLTIENIMSMPISKLENMSLKEQREFVSRLGSAANKRLVNLQKNDIYNSAVRRLELGGGKISVRGKNKDDLTKEFIRARDFLKNKFSSASNWKKTIRNIAKKSDYEGITGSDTSDLSKAFSIYDVLREIEPEITKRANKYELTSYIKSIMYLFDSTESIIDRSISWLQERSDKLQNDYENNTSRFSDSIEYDIPPRARNKRKRKR